GELVTRELLAFQVRGDLGQGEGLALTGDYHGAAALDEPGGGYGQDGHPGELGMRVEKVLDLDHGNILAAADDDVLRATRDRDVAVAVEGGAVARLEPAAFRVTGRRELGPLAIPHKR